MCQRMDKSGESMYGEYFCMKKGRIAILSLLTGQTVPKPDLI